MYDYLIVGCGLFGSVFSRIMTDNGKRCLVIDKRDHVGGNCYSKKINDIDIHAYGPHIFHTDNEEVWNFIKNYTLFNNFIYKPKVFYKDKIYSFPINLFTLYQLYDVKTPNEAKEIINKNKLNINNPANFEEMALSSIGKELYDIFIYGYTKKQWNKDPRDLPSFIFKRLPIRMRFDENYYFHKYQGIPINGYDEMFKNLLDGIEIRLKTDYFDNRDYFNNISNKIIFTGEIDRYYNYIFGRLEYRSLDFENIFLEIEDYQGNAAINYTDYIVPYTRIIEHKHFNWKDGLNYTFITKEYPINYNNKNIPYYPINDDMNNNIYEKYKSESEKNSDKILFCGRLGEYKYYDMDSIIYKVIELTKNELKK